MWRINVPALKENFSEFSKFPDIRSYKFDGSVLFVAGETSDYIL